MTNGQQDLPGVPIPGSEVRLGIDIRRTADPDRFEFAAIPEHGPERVWRAFGDVVRSEYGLKITRIEVDVDPELSAGITGSLMRKIPLGSLMDYVRAKIALSDEPAVQANARLRVPVTAGGRTPMTDELLREVAEVYLDETGPGQPRGAVKRMAEHFGRPEETVRTWLARSRKAGWLGPSVKGRPGAERGPRFFEYALFERIDGTERVLSGIATENFRLLTESDEFRRLPNEEAEAYLAELRERHAEAVEASAKRRPAED